MESNPWNSLEVIKLIINSLTPAFILLLGIYINNAIKRIEHLQWKNQKLIDKRLTLYDDLAPLLNDLLGYFTYSGNWKSFTPQQIIEIKQVLERKLRFSKPLFSREFFNECVNFMDICYESHSGDDELCKLKTDFEPRKESFDESWDPRWEQLFSGIITRPQTIRSGYKRIMDIFTNDIGLKRNTFSDSHDRISSGVSPSY